MWTDTDKILRSAHLCWRVVETTPAWEPHSQPMSSLAGHPWSCRRRRHRRQLEQRGSWVGKVQIKQLSQRGLLWLTRNWSSCCNVICVCWRQHGGQKPKPTCWNSDCLAITFITFDQRDQPSQPVGIGLTTVWADTTKRIQMWIPI